MVATPELLRSWEITTHHLNQAFVLVPVPDTDKAVQKTLAFYREFIEHNELGLAFEQLYSVGEVVAVPPDFWKELRLAAENMNLTEWTEKIDRWIQS